MEIHVALVKVNFLTSHYSGAMFDSLQFGVFIHSTYAKSCKACGGSCTQVISSIFKYSGTGYNESKNCRILAKFLYQQHPHRHAWYSYTLSKTFQLQNIHLWCVARWGFFWWLLPTSLNYLIENMIFLKQGKTNLCFLLPPERNKMSIRAQVIYKLLDI